MTTKAKGDNRTGNGKGKGKKQKSRFLPLDFAQGAE
jgi:hypothetical protein